MHPCSSGKCHTQIYHQDGGHTIGNKHHHHFPPPPWLPPPVPTQTQAHEAKNLSKGAKSRVRVFAEIQNFALCARHSPSITRRGRDTHCSNCSARRRHTSSLHISPSTSSSKALVPGGGGGTGSSPPPLVQATVNDRKATEPTPRVAWTEVLLSHRTARAATLQNHSGIHNSTAGLNAAQPRHTVSRLFSNAP